MLIDTSTIIWICSILGVILLLTIIGVADYAKRKKLLEYELEHPRAPIEYEYHVIIKDLRCTVVTSKNLKCPVAQKYFLVSYEILDSDENDKAGSISVDEETYNYLDIGMTGYMAFINDNFFAFTADE